MTPTQAIYAREIRREARDKILLVSLLRTWPPTASLDIGAVVSFVWGAADRCRNGGVDLPKTLALKTVAERLSDDPSVLNWRALIEAAREAHAELDASINYLVPA